MKGKGNNQVEMSDEDAVTQREALIPDRLPAYLSEAFSDLYEEDGLLVLGRGMGLLPLISAFVRFYGDAERGHVSIVNCDDSEDSQGIHRSNEDKKTLAERGKAGGTETSPPLVFVIGLKESERNAILATLQRWGTPPNLLPTMVTNESGQGKDRAGKLILNLWCSSASRIVYLRRKRADY